MLAQAAQYNLHLEFAETADGERRWEFVWDCRWRAEREELLTPWGYPDQVRAAREWGWDCFERWEERGA